MKIVFIGCVKFSAAMLRMLVDHPDVELVGIATRNKSDFNADFQDLQPLAEQARCPVFQSTGNDQAAMSDWLRERQPDIIYCVGWSFLLSAEVLTIPAVGVLGYHPTALPLNRGRHPIIWALALGLKETASTFFLMNEDADSGDILSQIPVDIDLSDDASSLYEKLIQVATPQLKELTSALAMNKAKPTPQNHALANYWRKRSVNDGCIDWRMSAKNIRNLVRALTHPYPGAHCEHEGNEIKIWHVREVGESINNIEPGKVLAVTSEYIRVKCGDGVLDITEHTFSPLPKKGSYL